MWNTDWVKVPVIETTQRVICAAANRVLVGTPLCALDLSYSTNIVCLSVSHRPRSRLSESKFELHDQCCNICDNIQCVPETFKAVRDYPLSRVSIVESESGSSHA